MSIKVLLIGGFGIAGSFFSKYVSFDKKIKIYSFKKKDLDLTKKKSLKRKLKEINIDVIINFSGLTDVDLCQQKPVTARKLNALNIYEIIQCLRLDQYLIQISTDQVYPGIKGPYYENQIEPINIYGRTKLEGEKISLKKFNSVVLRTNFFGNSLVKRKSLSDFFINALKYNKKINIFSDIFFSPLHLSSLSEIICNIIKKKRLRGTYNLGSRNGMSKAEFALKIANHLNLSTKNLNVITSDKLFNRAKRPKDVRMNVNKFSNDYNILLPDLNEEIKKIS
jgi:dTDP-4-dehydrorhamnose reductase